MFRRNQAHTFTEQVPFFSMRTTRGRRGARGRRIPAVVQKRVSLKSPPPDGWSLGYIKKLKPLPGRGDSVFLAEVNSSGERFVLKKLDKNTGLYPASASAQLERDLHMSFKHPNVIRTLASFETESSIYLMMEYAESGDLFDAVLRPDHSELRASQYLRDVILGLQYIHSLNVVHRDVKAENIVVTSNGQCKLIDFGFATRIRKGNRYLNDKLIAGTIDYLSPEIIRKRPYNQGIDVWAIGVLAYILVCRHVPFAPHSSQLESTFAKRSVVTRAILNIEIYRGSSYKGVSSVAKDFFERILVKDPNARMTLDEMLVHPFLNRVEKDDPMAAAYMSGAPAESGRAVAVSKNTSQGANTGGGGPQGAPPATTSQDEIGPIDERTVADLASVHGHAAIRRRSSSSSSGRTCSTCSGHSVSSGHSAHSLGSCSSSGGSSSGSDSDGLVSRRSSAAGLCGSRAEEGESDEAEFQVVSAGTRSARSTSNASQHSYTSQLSHHSHTSQHSHVSATHPHSHHSRTSSRGSVSAALMGVSCGGGGSHVVSVSPPGSGGGGGGGGKTSPSAVGVGVGSPIPRTPPCHLSRSDDLPVGLPSLTFAADIRNSPPNPDSGSPPYKHIVPVATHDLMVSHLDQQFSSMDLDAENPDSSSVVSSSSRSRTIVQQHHPRSSRNHTRHSSDEESTSSNNGSKPRARHKFVSKKSGGGGGDLGKRFGPA